MDDDNDDEVGWGLASDEKEAKEDIFEIKIELSLRASPLI